MAKVLNLCKVFFLLYLLICCTIGSIMYSPIAIPQILGGIIFAVSLLALGKTHISLTDKAYFISILFFITLFIIGEFVVLEWFQDLGSDFAHVKFQAIHNATHNDLLKEHAWYFHAYENNINITIFISFLYSILNNYKYIMYLCVITSVLAGTITSLTVRNITRNNNAAIIAMVSVQAFLLLSCRTYIPYTSNPGILFPILILFVYSTQISGTWKFMLISIVGIIGYEVKATTTIPIISILAIEMLSMMKNKRFPNFKFALLSVCVATTFSMAEMGRSHIWNRYGYSHDGSIYRGMSYFLYLGQYTPTSGQWSVEADEGGNYQGTEKERNKYFLSVAEQAISERGFLGNLKYIVVKSVISWGDINRDVLQINDKVIDNLANYIRGIVWFGTLCITIFFSIAHNRKQEYAFILTLIGITGYQVLFECSLVYVLMFSPIIFVLLGVAVSQLHTRIK